MKKLIFFLLLQINPWTIQAQQKPITISGILTDSATRQPLGDVEIFYLVGDPGKEREPAPVPSNSSGFFSIPLQNVEKGTPIFIYFSYPGYTYRSLTGEIYLEHTTNKVAIKNFLGEIRMIPKVERLRETENKSKMKTLYIRLTKEKTGKAITKNVKLFYFIDLPNQSDTPLNRTIVPVKEDIPGLFELTIDPAAYPNIRLISQSKHFAEYNSLHSTDQSYLNIALGPQDPLKGFWSSLGSTGLTAVVGLGSNILSNDAYAQSKRKDNPTWQRDLNYAETYRRISTVSTGVAMLSTVPTVILYFKRNKKIKDRRKQKSQ